MTHLTENGHLKYYRVSIQDDEWLDTQTEGVRQLWRELSKADPYGTKEGVTFQTKLKKTAFCAAKKKIEEYGAFQIFFVVKNKTKEWRVINNHGANIHSYWNPPVQKREVFAQTTKKDSEANSGTPTNSTASDFSPSLKNEQNTTTNTDAAVFSFSVSSAQQLSDLPANPVAPETVELNKDLPPSQPLCDSNQTNQTKVLSVSQFSVGKIPPAAHVKSKQNTSCSHQDAPQAPLDSQMSNPTPKSFNPPSSPFSLEVEEVLSRLKNSLESRGRMKEIEWEKTLTSLKSYPEQTVLDAVSHCLERLDNIKNLGGYLRTALTQGYKPSQAKEAPKTTKVSQEQLKSTPKALEDFLSEESLKRFNEFGFRDKYLEKCVEQLMRDWSGTDDWHRGVIAYWKGMQRNKVWG